MSRAHVRGMVKKEDEREKRNTCTVEEGRRREEGEREGREREKGKAVYIYARACDLSARA